ncbi:M1 family metallopeptidase [Chitinophaga sp. Cy-1792]|uniref:M1 family metallopeptidase n=1 Tax=Chitinophaga sp. Cy-1792 TaxID=2608339 RepID=UPI00141E7DB0|nr:M1 family metallopeptidase [Chitinophaga sp. Cy-1792]NIG54979.1 M1 family metallopeptidase [Chitinophaga sp. Cy-1792]
MRKHLLLLLMAVGYSAVQAQELYMPRNIRNAYTAQTRDKSGRPGPKYWQNKGNYDIHLKLSLPSRTVQGTETIQYTNNSPDTLKNLWIRFIPNLHKITAPRDGYHSNDFLTEGVTIDKFVYNGQELKFNNDFGTVGRIKLPTAVMPKGGAKVEITWHYDLSKESGREGMIDSTTAFAAYAYPRISVFDDYNGWDQIAHTDRAEFYNDFNDYTVSVTVPKNYVVWGTGNLLNPEEVLQPEFAAKLKASYTADNTINIASLKDNLAHKVTRQQDFNTWKFEAKHISDVVYGTSDHYVWDAGSSLLDTATGLRCSVQAAYNDTAADFHHSVEFARKSLGWFSNHWPGIKYPYPVMTAFQGYADMEYPMMVNDNTVEDDMFFAKLVQDHEMAHTYFPFYMGINETRYAFMDEGWATTFEYLIGIADVGKEKADDFYKRFRVARYISDPSTEEDQPIISMSNQVSGMGYGSNSYGKASLSYLALKDLLGDEEFKKALHMYMDTWHGKHPIPWDYFNIINTATGKNLNWFWQNWFFTNNYIDLAVAGVKGSAITIKNVGGFAIPFDMEVTDVNGEKRQYHYTPAIWQKNAREVVVQVPGKSAIKEVNIDGGIFMDATPADNNWKK